MRFQTVEADEVLAFRLPTSIFQNSHTRNHSSSKTQTWASKKADKKSIELHLDPRNHSESITRK